MGRISWEDGLALERDVAILLQKQAAKGIYFNQGKAVYFISLLNNKQEEEYSIIRPYLDYEIENLETKNKGKDADLYPYNFVRKIHLKNGDYTSSVINHYEDPSIVLGEFSRISINEPSISKRQLVTSCLLRNGWEPDLFTETGQPKLTNKGEPVESLLALGDFGRSLANWYIYNHRKSSITGFLENVRPDGRISSQFSGLTNTFRHKHKVVANIPRPTSLFGKEMRQLFTVPSDKVFVGADVAGLELRMLAHHMGDEEYIVILLEDDIHTFNMLKAGLPNRDAAKTFIYAFL